jgi:prepilin-type N-terminal cleavage/methylation domain-containing protein/prepilin-type processing-associated H-X9-DG protein
MIFHLNRCRYGWSGGARRSGFTLIEVLVVVAIIALLVAILIPSLARAREGARSAQCLSGLKQMAATTTMYTVESKGRLPGPIHPMIYRYTDDFRLRQEANPGRAYWSAFLPYFLRRYMTSSRTKTVDETANCTTAETIVPWRKEEIRMNQPDRRPTQYVVNSNWMRPDRWPNRKTTGPGATLPYIGTNPAYYFGYINLGDDIADVMQKKPEQRPKKIDRVKLPGKEWMVADAWHYQIGGRAAGPWPFPEDYASYSLKDGDRYFVPTWPFHMTTRRFANPVGGVYTETNRRSPRFTEGRTNTAFFDGHAEGVRGWRGSANPCYVEDPGGPTGCPD